MFGNALGLQVTLIVILGLAQGLVHDVFAKDIYPSLAALQKSEKEGMDYRVRLEKRDSPFAVLAIHAGKIEVGTGELAQTVANDGYSLYLFEAIKPDEKTSWRLHVSSANFARSERCSWQRGRSIVCLSMVFVGKTRSEYVWAEIMLNRESTSSIVLKPAFPQS
jgi:phage replication-related protein YjqB (UPF0714/DUF867 family)